MLRDPKTGKTLYRLACIKDGIYLFDGESKQIWAK